ncbi:DNA polymerase Y family protein [uncultured Castellaniella sp.]|uniref:Y-family DNA polymerase n=1 Tax=uncultured Castellaniella sp. TaxID=647907 RepID=UPI0026062287|nr:DNA polymerase Y family protein [uncultured Castellaniella sp.]
MSPPSTLLQPVACALLRFTPDLALAPESIVLMDVTASLRLFGGIRRLRAQVRQVLAAFDAAPARCGAPAVAADGRPAAPLAAPASAGAGAAESAIVSVAASGPAAWMLARSGRGGSALTRRSWRRALAQVPLAVAPPARPFADWFRDLGCETLADLRRLPRVGLKKRCGPAVLDWLDQLALGHGDSATGFMPYRRLELPPEFDAAFELPDHIEHAPALQWAAQRLILQLCGWLAGRRQDVTAFTVMLAHERRQHRTPSAGRLLADGPTALPITLGAPSHDPVILIRLVQEHLARLILPASVISVRLKATRFQAARGPSLDLFPEPGGTPQDHAQLLALLSARLGAENLLAPAPVADHRPERAARWAPLDQAASGRPAAARGGFPDAPLPRPAWLLDAPIPLAMQGPRPFYGTPLRLVSPAERLDCGWQDGGPVTRDYFVAEDESGVCYWIFRTQDADAPGWFLHGLFG